MPQQLILQPLGLVTQPGKLVSLPPGAMSVAENIYIRSPYKIERARQWAFAASVPLSSGMRAWMLPSGSNAWSLVVYENALNDWYCAWNSPSLGGYYPGASILAEYGSYFYPRDDGGVWAVEAAGYQYVNMDCGVVCFERSADPPSGSGAMVSNAGIRAPIGFISAGADVLEVEGGAIPWGYGAAYTAIIRRKGLSGAEYVSAPCASIYVTWIQGAEADYPSANVGGTLSFHNEFVRAGDFVEIYRTRTQPQEKDFAFTSLGADYFRVCSIKLTSGDVGNWNVPFVDRSTDDALGDALYTNDGFQGVQGTTYPPPAAACMAQFKGYTFYGNIKQPAQLSLRPVNGWHSVGTHATNPLPDNNFGLRLGIVNYTNGNATITAVNPDLPSKLCVGMRMTLGPGLPGGGVRIQSVGVSTFTVTPAPTSNATNQIVYLSDVIEINGTEYLATDSGKFGFEISYLGTQRSMRVYGIENYAPPGDDLSRQSIALVTFRSENMSGTRAGMPTFTIRATHGNRFDPPLPRIEAAETALTVSPVEQEDGWCVSEQHQPWRVPLANYERIGGGAKILAIAPTKDAVIFFTTKGVKRLSGSGGSAGDGFDWRMDPVDETLILTGPRAWCVLRDVVYARTSRGVVAITSDGLVMPITEGVIGDLLPGRMVAPGAAYVVSTSTCVWMEADEANNEVILFDHSSSTTSIYRYNIVTKTWVTDKPSASAAHHGAYFRRDGILCVLAGTQISAPQTSGGTLPVSRIHFQPICGESPFEQKHWQTADPLIVSAADVVAQQIFMNGSVAYSTVTLNSEDTVNAKRFGFAVPCDAPAIAPAFTFGMDIAASTSLFEMIGVAVQFETISFARLVR
jgi:hypothetical protein